MISFLKYLIILFIPLSLYSKSDKKEVYKLQPLIPYTQANASELEDLEKVRTYMRNWFKGGTAPDIASATIFYNNLNIVVSGSSISGNKTTPKACNNHLLNLSRHYYHKKDASSLEMLTNILWLLNESGYCAECAWNDYTDRGYDTRSFFQGLVLIFEFLPEDLRSKWVEAVKYTFFMNQCWARDWPKTQELNSDLVYNNFRYALGTIALGIEDDNEAVRQLKGYKRLLDVSNVPSKAAQDWIKPDGTGFHHWNHYNHYMYAFSSYSEILFALRDTQFQISKESYENFRDMAYASTIMCHENGDYAMSLAGRYPIDQVSPMKKSALKKLAYAGGDIYGTVADSILAGEYNRIYGDDPTLLKEYSKRKFPEGFWQFNWSPIALYRKNNWVATAHGINDTFWGTEAYKGENRCGRYQSYGALEIMYKGGYSGSGFVLKGWDWNLVPGTTTKYLPHESLKPPKYRSDEIAASNFAGALRFNEILAGTILDKGEIGMYGNDFQQKGDITPTHDASFKFKKSYFFLGDYIVCLGSNIQCSDSKNNIVTTLFQGFLKNNSDPIILDNTEIADFPHNQSISGDGKWILDAYNTGYCIVSGNELNIARKNQISLQENGAGTTNGNYSSAFFNHGTSPNNASYEYVVKPATTAPEMIAFNQKINKNKPYNVLQQDASAHIIKTEKIEAYTLFTENTNIKKGKVKSNTKPCLVMLNGDEEQMQLTLVNPDLGLYYRANIWPEPINVELTIRGIWEIFKKDDDISLKNRTDSTTTLLFTTKDGEPYDILLKAGGEQTGIRSPQSIDAFNTRLVKISPNPFLTNFSIELEKNHGFNSAILYDVAGRKLFEQAVDENEYISLSISGENVPKGMCLLKLIGENRFQYFKVLKE